MTAMGVINVAEVLARPPRPWERLELKHITSDLTEAGYELASVKKLLRDFWRELRLDAMSVCPGMQHDLVVRVQNGKDTRDGTVWEKVAAAGWRPGRRPTLSWIYVAPAYRGLGVGGILFDRMRRLYGTYDVEGPVSPVMRRILERRGLVNRVVGPRCVMGDGEWLPMDEAGALLPQPLARSGWDGRRERYHRGAFTRVRRELAQRRSP